MSAPGDLAGAPLCSFAWLFFGAVLPPGPPDCACLTARHDSLFSSFRIKNAHLVGAFQALRAHAEDEAIRKNKMANLASILRNWLVASSERRGVPPV